MPFINYMLHYILVESFLAWMFYQMTIRMLAVKQEKQKYIFIIAVCKVFFFNLIIGAMKYQLVIFDQKPYIHGIANTVAACTFFGAMKIITDKSYLRIFLTSMLFDVFGTSFVAVPYMLVYMATNPKAKTSTLDEPMGWYTLLSILLLCVFQYIVKKIMDRFFRNFDNWNIRFKPLWWTIIVLVYGYGQLSLGGNGRVNLIWYVSVSVILMAGGAVILYGIAWVYHNYQVEKRKKENQMLQIEHSVMKEYYNTLENQLELTRKFHHDIEKHIAVLQELKGNEGQQEGDEEDVLARYALEIEEEYAKIIPVTYCDNPVVNAILMNKMNQCKAHGISLEVMMQGFSMGDIKELDMIAILSHVLDHAIETCTKLSSKERKCVTIQSGQRGENLFLKVTSSVGKSAENITDSKWIVKKESRVIRRIVEKYHGMMDVTIQDDSDGRMLEVLLQLPMVAD